MALAPAHLAENASFRSHVKQLRSAINDFITAYRKNYARGGGSIMQGAPIRNDVFALNGVLSPLLPHPR